MGRSRVVLLGWLAVGFLPGLLLLAYAAWVAFATPLNAEIWRRNRDR